MELKIELEKCCLCNTNPRPEMFYGKTYIVCNECKKMTKDYTYPRDAYIEWNEMND